MSERLSVQSPEANITELPVMQPETNEAGFDNGHDTEPLSSDDLSAAIKEVEAASVADSLSINDELHRQSLMYQGMAQDRYNKDRTPIPMGEAELISSILPIQGDMIINDRQEQLAKSREIQITGNAARLLQQALRSEYGTAPEEGTEIGKKPLPADIVASITERLKNYELQNQNPSDAQDFDRALELLHGLIDNPAIGREMAGAQLERKALEQASRN